jgi:hypothetical protein
MMRYFPAGLADHFVAGEIENLLCHFIALDYNLLFVQNPDCVQVGIKGLLPLFGNAGSLLVFLVFHGHDPFSRLSLAGWGTGWIQRVALFLRF